MLSLLMPSFYRTPAHANTSNSKLHSSVTELYLAISAESSDVVLETKVLVSRRLEDKNTSLGLGLEIKVLVLILVLTKKS